MAFAVRRIVTGHNEKGKSVFVEDRICPHVVKRPNGVTVIELWSTDEHPADNSGYTDPGIPQKVLDTGRDGSLFHIVVYPPDSERAAAIAEARARGEQISTRYDGKGRHFGFHKTETVDYAVVLKGEIHALMDEGEVKMTEGDVLIQRGTAHAWSNRSDAPCSVLFAMIPAKPL
jgi:hypothetical protein